MKARSGCNPSEILRTNHGTGAGVKGTQGQSGSVRSATVQTKLTLPRPTDSAMMASFVLSVTSLWGMKLKLRQAGPRPSREQAPVHECGRHVLSKTKPKPTRTPLTNLAQVLFPALSS